MIARLNSIILVLVAFVLVSGCSAVRHDNMLNPNLPVASAPEANANDTASATLGVITETPLQDPTIKTTNSRPTARGAKAPVKAPAIARKTKPARAAKVVIAKVAKVAPAAVSTPTDRNATATGDTNASELCSVDQIAKNCVCDLNIPTEGGYDGLVLPEICGSGLATLSQSAMALTNCRLPNAGCDDLVLEVNAPNAAPNSAPNAGDKTQLAAAGQITPSHPKGGITGLKVSKSGGPGSPKPDGRGDLPFPLPTFVQDFTQMGILPIGGGAAFLAFGFGAVAFSRRRKRGKFFNERTTRHSIKHLLK